MTLARACALVCLMIASAVVTGSAAQKPIPSEHPKFDAASIKLHKPDVSGPQYTLTQLKDNHLGAVNAQLKGLIAWAYQLKPDEAKLISGLPAWATSKNFDIDAEATGNPKREQMLEMLQSLLKDRFKLSVHTESREVPVYALVLANAGRPGPQLQPHSDSSPCQKLAPGQPAPLVDFGAIPPPPPVCGRFVSGAKRLAGNNVTMQGLAGTLSYQPSVDRPVVDRTGLTEKVDLSLTYTPDLQADLQPGSNAVAAGSNDPSSPPSLVTALREQLGLKLESSRASMAVLVVDHVEEPSPN